MGCGIPKHETQNRAHLRLHKTSENSFIIKKIAIRAKQHPSFIYRCKLTNDLRIKKTQQFYSPALSPSIHWENVHPYGRSARIRAEVLGSWCASHTGKHISAITGNCVCRLIVRPPSNRAGKTVVGAGSRRDGKGLGGMGCFWQAGKSGEQVAEGFGSKCTHWICPLLCKTVVFKGANVPSFKNLPAPFLSTGCKCLRRLICNWATYQVVGIKFFTYLLQAVRSPPPIGGIMCLFGVAASVLVVGDRTGLSVLLQGSHNAMPAACHQQSKPRRTNN